MKRIEFYFCLRTYFRRGSLMILAFCAGCSKQPLDGFSASESHSSAEAPFTYGEWTSCMIGGGGYLLGVVPCPSQPQRFYAFSDVGGMYRSDDGATTWSMIHGSLPAPTTHHNVRDLAVDPRDADHLVAALGDLWTPAGVFISRDGGSHWEKSLSASFTGNGPFRAAGPLLARNPHQPDTLMVVSEGTGLWRSGDSGKSWQEIPGLRDLMPTHLTYDPYNPEQLWLCAASYQGAIQGRDLDAQAGFYRSRDGGTTWQRLSGSGPSEVLRDPQDGKLLYGLFGDEGVSVSRDDGNTWKPWNEGLQVHPEKIKEPLGWFYNHTGLAAGPNFVLVTTAKGWIYRQFCGQKQWQRVVPVSFSNICYGTKWHAADRDPMGQEGRGSATSSITVDPRDPGHWFISDWFAIYQTLDSGKHWTLSVDGIEPTYIHGFQQDPTHPGLVHLFMEDNGAFWSDDGGRKFHLERGISKDVKCLAISPVDSRCLVALGGDPSGTGGRSNQIYLSSDGGRNWTLSPMKGLGALRKENGCTVVADPAHTGRFYVTVAGKVSPGTGGVYRSDDSGQSWVWMGWGLENRDAPFFYGDIWHIGRELAMDREGTLLAISHRQGSLRKWNPLTTSWVPLGPDFTGHPNDLCADPDRSGCFYLALEESGVFRTENGGKTWKKILEGPVRHIAVDLFHPKRVAAGTSDGVSVSMDCGKNWSLPNRRLPNREFNSVGFVGNHVLAGSNGSGAFWMNLPPIPGD